MNHRRVDPYAVMPSQHERQRLSAESLRDALLAHADQLDLSMGGATAEGQARSLRESLKSERLSREPSPCCLHAHRTQCALRRLCRV